MELIEGLSRLKEIFDKKSGKPAHILAHDVLKSISLEKNNIHFAFKYFIENYLETASQTSITSDFIIPLYTNNKFSLEMGIFSPLESGETSCSYAMTHDHGDNILSTINTFGSGYKSIIYEKGFEKKTDGSVILRPKCIKKHKPNNIEIIDAKSAHTIFYPDTLTITYALWSSSQNFYGRCKTKIKIYFKEKYLKKKFGLKAVSYITQNHFCIKKKSFYLFPYAPGGRPTNNFFNNFLYKLQQIEFSDTNYLQQTFAKLDIDVINYSMINEFLNGRIFGQKNTGDEVTKNERNVHISEFKNVLSNYDLKW